MRAGLRGAAALRAEPVAVDRLTTTAWAAPQTHYRARPPPTSSVPRTYGPPPPRGLRWAAARDAPHRRGAERVVHHAGVWRDLEVGGRREPLEFKGASAAFVGTRCFIFGGYGGGFSDETHCLECAEPLAPEWSVLQETSDEKPPRRAHHTTWAHGGGVWVFGGASSRGYLNDVWRLTLEGGKHPRGRWRECACVGEKPVPREGHTGVQIGTSLVVVGGYDGVSWRSDSYALNLDTLVWWRVVDQGAPNAMMGRSGGAQCGNRPVN